MRDTLKIGEDAVTPQSTVQFALLGCGRIAVKHAELLGENHIEGAALTAVCDIRLDRAKHFGQKYGVPWFTDLDVMMETMGNRIDVVNILTESGNHCANTLQVARYRKHIVVEKPM